MLRQPVFLVVFALVLSVRLPSSRAEDTRAILDKYCVSCHGKQSVRGGLRLDSLAIEQSPKVWKRVWDRLRARHMPPADRPQPTEAERGRVTAWIEQALARHTLDGHPDPGPLPPRRLNAREHANTFRDLVIVKDGAQPRRVAYTPRPNGTVNLYHAIVPPPEHPCAFVFRLLPPDTTDGGFDAISDNLSIPPFLVEKYLRTSKVLLDDLFAHNPRLGASDQWPLYQSLTRLQKGPPPRGLTQAQALRTFLREFATRAFRRPIPADEVEKYARLFDAGQARGEDFQTAMRLPLQAILVSPRFTLLWSDAGTEPTNAAPVRPLDDHELATRLAYFLWSSLPDRELFQAAQQGRLRDPKVLEQQTRRLLNDRRVTSGLIEGFLCQWLQLDRLDRSAPDADLFPLYFQNNLGELMKQELLLFADAIVVEDRSILEFVDANWGFLCQPLAQHYGIADFPGKKPPSNAAPPWYRLKYPDRRRGGVLTMGKVLTGTSQPVRTSPVHRGKWVLETLLGAPPPPPPPDVDNQLKDSKDVEKKKLTVPQRLALHRDNPACVACHRLIDPLGTALENFDPVGRWRARDREQLVDARGTLVDGQQFNGIEEFKTLLLTRKEDFVRAFVEQMLSYALGRKLEYYDLATTRAIVQAVLRDETKFARVVVEVVQSYPFRHRRVKEKGD